MSFYEPEPKPQNNIIGVILICIAVALIILVAKQAHSDTDTPFVMRNFTIRPPQERIRPEPSVRIDRYDIRQFRNDPSVLVSTPAKIVETVTTETKIVEKIKYVVERPEQDVKVTTKWEEE